MELVGKDQVIWPIAAMFPGVQAGKEGSVGGNSPGGRGKAMAVQDAFVGNAA